MQKYIRVYKLGFDEGIKDGYNDNKNNKIKLLKKKNDKEVLSKIYDIGYIEGYEIISTIEKNSLYFNKKI